MATAPSLPTTDDHEPYSKRAMARDQVEVMQALGFERFAVVGHDRGGRCAYRMALDHPERIAALSVLDIIPTAEHFQRTDMAFAMGYWHWFFLAQPHPLPERLIASDPDAFYLRRGRSMFDDEALAEYRRCFTDPDTIHAMCEDYRAGATIDMRLDEEDQKAGRRIACPVQALWGLQERTGSMVRRAGRLARLGRSRGRPRHRLRPLPRRGSARRKHWRPCSLSCAQSLSRALISVRHLSSAS